MRIALAQPNPVVGDIDGNVEKLIADIDAARADGARLVVFPELAIVGYPPKDLLLKPAFVRANTAAIERVARSCRQIAALVGFVEENADATGHHLRNSAALCADGKIVSVHHKSLLPTYDVFDERRYFEPGPGGEVVEVAGQVLGISICEGHRLSLASPKLRQQSHLPARHPLLQLATRRGEFPNRRADQFAEGRRGSRLR